MKETFVMSLSRCKMPKHIEKYIGIRHAKSFFLPISIYQYKIIFFMHENNFELQSTKLRQPTEGRDSCLKKNILRNNCKFDNLAHTK